LFLLFLILIIGSIAAVTVGGWFLTRRYLRQKEYKHPEPKDQEPHEPEDAPHHVDLPEPPDL